MNLQENVSRLKDLMNIISEQEHSDWGNSTEKLQKTYKFKNFEEAMSFVNKVAKIAEQQNHHPDITINYNKVKISIFDHDKGKVSDKCHRFVKAVNKLSEIKEIQEEDKSAKFIKCRNCKKKYTQTIHKGKKSKPICPYCGTHEELS